MGALHSSATQPYFPMLAQLFGLQKLKCYNTQKKENNKNQKNMIPLASCLLVLLGIGHGLLALRHSSQEWNNNQTPSEFQGHFHMPHWCYDWEWQMTWKKQNKIYWTAWQIISPNHKFRTVNDLNKSKLRMRDGLENKLEWQMTWKHQRLRAAFGLQ